MDCLLYESRKGGRDTHTQHAHKAPQGTCTHARMAHADGHAQGTRTGHKHRAQRTGRTHAVATTLASRVISEGDPAGPSSFWRTASRAPQGDTAGGECTFAKALGCAVLPSAH
mmetsp:Transcript_47318/g.119170  ORF Transcript_47318/g.119170 Transcript_47318/m.119170 type:complete len:113 (+) Transcript_47318:151-489(+)